MSKVRIGFVGVGFMGQAAHLSNYVNLPDVEVVAIAEVLPDLARKVAAKYAIPNVYASHDEMLSKEKLDGVVASQPFTRHGTLVPEIIKYKIPVFTEKPLAGSIEVAEKILTALKNSGTWHMVGYHKRSDPATIYAKAEIDRLKQTGELGKLKYVRITMPAGDWIASGNKGIIRTGETPTGGFVWDPPASDMDKKTYDEYNALVNYYIHQINLMRHLLGEKYEVTYADPNGVMMVMTTPSGVTGTLEMSPFQTSVDWAEVGFAAFEKGFVQIRLPAPLARNRPGTAEVFKDPGNGVTPSTIVPQLPWVHAMENQAANFVKAIKGEAKPPCDAFEAIEDLYIARNYIRLFRGK